MTQTTQTAAIRSAFDAAARSAFGQKTYGKLSGAARGGMYEEYVETYRADNTTALTAWLAEYKAAADAQMAADAAPPVAPPVAVTPLPISSGVPATLDAGRPVAAHEVFGAEPTPEPVAASAEQSAFANRGGLPAVDAAEQAQEAARAAHEAARAAHEAARAAILAAAPGETVELVSGVSRLITAVSGMPVADADAIAAAITIPADGQGAVAAHIMNDSQAPAAVIAAAAAAAAEAEQARIDGLVEEAAAEAKLAIKAVRKAESQFRGGYITAGEHSWRYLVKRVAAGIGRGKAVKDLEGQLGMYTSQAVDLNRLIRGYWAWTLLAGQKSTAEQPNPLEEKARAAVNYTAVRNGWCLLIESVGMGTADERYVLLPGVEQACAELFKQGVEAGWTADDTKDHCSTLVQRYSLLKKEQADAAEVVAQQKVVVAAQEQTALLQKLPQVANEARAAEVASQEARVAGRNEDAATLLQKATTLRQEQATLQAAEIAQQGVVDEARRKQAAAAKVAADLKVAADKAAARKAADDKAAADKLAAANNATPAGGKGRDTTKANKPPVPVESTEKQVGLLLDTVRDCHNPADVASLACTIVEASKQPNLVVKAMLTGLMGSKKLSQGLKDLLGDTLAALAALETAEPAEPAEPAVPAVPADVVAATANQVAAIQGQPAGQPLPGTVSGVVAA